MAKQILVRDVPDQICSWIEQERSTRHLSQQEVILSVLSEASQTNGDGNGVNQQLSLFQSPTSSAFPTKERIPFTFIDLFAGIGGFRFPLEAMGGKCLFSSEIDKYSQRTYNAWFGSTPHGDITKISVADIPDHDILAAGFPCQPFSLAGVSKKKSLGHDHGFACKAQGTLFFNLASIIEVKRPPIIVLENVKNLKSHDGGRTWTVIQGTLDDLEYTVFDRVIDAADYVPQHRERVYIVGFDKRVFGDRPPFEFPAKPDGERPKLKEILEKKVDNRYTLSNHLWKYLQDYAERHRQKGNGFGFGLANINGVTRTLSARYHKDGSEILIPQNGDNPRRLTPTECLRLMGFPDNLKIAVSDTQAYRQFGNAVVPKVAAAVLEQVGEVMRWQLSRTKNGCLLKKKSARA